jgi:KTSC domain
MTYIAIESTTIQRVAYEASQSTLLMDFCDGSTYSYMGVPPVVFEDLLASASKGTFFNQRIRDHYGYARLT